MKISRTQIPSLIDADVILGDVSALALLESTDVNGLLAAILEPIECEKKDELTIQDLFFFAALQRIKANRINSFQVKSKCDHPLIIVDRNGAQLALPSVLKIEEGDAVLTTSPCNTDLIIELDISNLHVKHLDRSVLIDAEPEFRLPSAVDLFDGYVPEDRVAWIMLHLKPEFRSETYLGSKDSVWLAKLIKFVNDTDHGLINTLVCGCPSCGRISNVSWSINVDTFL